MKCRIGFKINLIYFRIPEENERKNKEKETETYKIQIEVHINRIQN